MKNIYTSIKILVLAGIVVLFQSCSNKTSFLASSVVPGAQGTVKITNDKNRNYAIDLNVTHLAEPTRLSPPQNVYIVWMETERNGLRKIGQLKTSSGFLSQTMKSSLETISTFEPKEIIISAEEDTDQEYPKYVVLRTGQL